jgi:hypothetical protein
MHEIVKDVDTRDDNHSTPSNHLKTRMPMPQPAQPVSFNLDGLSMQPFQGKYVGGALSDDISEPTVEGSFSDEDFSLSTEKSFRTTHEMHIPSGIASEDNNDDLSLSSINTKALLQITELSTRLRIQENTKLELLNQCLRLEGRLEKNDCKHAFLRIYKTENNKLREESAKMERDFMNDMNEIVTKMTDSANEYEDKLQQRDLDIKRLKEELRLLKVAKNLDDISTIETKSSIVSGSSSITK